ncbi:hypothetical protein CAC42_1735 [Sphaceloma murrayae]|uniref:Alanyl-transfer RNA synthetases family profile domain-containing protein n=1 Tax=Sphaceloma murrayae TaxID=2082308 RepID=A0A2K1QIN3_9PEZI|nr:hypothetical protein CAC42_1735 [Sphaceloma murrayae]
MATPPPPKTHLAFHYDANLHTTTTTVQSVFPLSQLKDPHVSLFKAPPPDSHIVTTTSTIFHPQGGGQPSDTGTMTSSDTTFTVLAARTTPEGQVLHLGTFSAEPFAPSSDITQTIDSAKRLYYSRLHTAGHVLGAAVRHLLQDEIAGFDELKASHFPDSAACEFQGLIEGARKVGIQSLVDDYVDKGMPVEIEWWDRTDFEREGLQRLIPEGMREGHEEWAEKLRVVRIRGAEVYPCGGTHVPTTRECGKTTVKKISRSKGTSRVSYSLVE